MEKEISRQIIIGGLIIIGIFVAILGVINGVEWTITFITSRNQAGEQNLNSQQEIEPATAVPDHSIDFSMPEKQFTLLFPLVVATPAAHTEIILENNTGGNITDVETTLLGNRGNQHTYLPITVTAEQYLLNTENLASKPDPMNPGIAIVATDSSLAGVSTVVNANGIKNNAVGPFLEPTRDMQFEFGRHSDGNTSQNTLVVTNLSNKIAEIQLSFSSTIPDKPANETTTPIAIEPLMTRTIDLAELVGSTQALAAFNSLLVSGTSKSFIGALATHDYIRNTWENIITGEVR